MDEHEEPVVRTLELLLHEPEIVAWLGERPARRDDDEDDDPPRAA